MKKIFILFLLLLTPLILKADNEIIYPFGQTNEIYYALIREPNGAVWNDANNTFFTWTDSAYSDYDVNMIDIGGGFFVGDFNTNITLAKSYPVIIKLRLGTSVATGDTAVAGDSINWNGTAEVNDVLLNIDTGLTKGYAKNAADDANLLDTATELRLLLTDNDLPVSHLGEPNYAPLIGMIAEYFADSNERFDITKAYALNASNDTNDLYDILKPGGTGDPNEIWENTKDIETDTDEMQQTHCYK